MTVVEIAQELVRIPSVNPEGNPGTEFTGEAACAAWIASFLKECGATCELHDVLPNRPNIIGRFPSSSGENKRILFAPHTDTVSVEGMTIEPFSGDIHGGCLWGRGSSDTKGPMAAMLWALQEAASWIGELPFEIWFAGLVGEEAGQFGAKTLAEQITFDFVLAGEPTSLQIVYTHKGACWKTLRTRGRAVHASCPNAGESAIYKMCDAINCIRRDIIPTLEKITDPALGFSTVSVGTISGGSKVNIVPDFCEAIIDMRTIPGQDLTIFDDLLKSKIPDIEITSLTSEPLQTNIDHPMIRILQSCGAGLAGAPWFCDAAIFATKGSPAIAIGPGSIAQAHTANEFIALDDLEQGGRFFLNFLKALRH